MAFPHLHPVLVRGLSQRPRWAGTGEEASGLGGWPGHHQGLGKPAEVTLAQLLELLATGTAFSGPAFLVLYWGGRGGGEKCKQTFPAGPGDKGGESGDPLDPGGGSVNGPGLAKCQEQNSVPPPPFSIGLRDWASSSLSGFWGTRVQSDLSSGAHCSVAESPSRQLASAVMAVAPRRQALLCRLSALSVIRTHDQALQPLLLPPPAFLVASPSE